MYIAITLPEPSLAAYVMNTAAHRPVASVQRKDKQIIKYYMTIILDDLLDLSRTPGAVCQSIQRRSAPEVDAGYHAS